jgi:hypothetical protein
VAAAGVAAGAGVVADGAKAFVGALDGVGWVVVDGDLVSMRGVFVGVGVAAAGMGAAHEVSGPRTSATATSTHGQQVRQVKRLAVIYRFILQCGARHT